MHNVREQILEKNREFVENFRSRPAWPKSPAKNAAILTCMDHRVDPASFAGLVEGDAHVIRNAGGRASDDAIRSLVVSQKMVGTKEWFVVQHTMCAMCTFTDETMGDLLDDSLGRAVLEEGVWRNVGDEPGSPHGHSVQWLTIDNVFDSVRNDVHRIANHPLVLPNISIFGYVFDLADGGLKQVDGAVRLGS